MLTTEEVQNLIEAAKKARLNAFIFKSNHSFGAAVLSTDGEIYGGCNMDGAIGSLGACAELVALHHAISHGKYQIKAVLVVDEDEYVYPCGSCLQVISQFYQTTGAEVEIVAALLNGEYKIKTLSELLPEKYLSSHFADKLRRFKNK